MGILDDALKDRFPLWKRLRTVPDEVDELKKKVAALEEKLGGKYPPDVCRFCGAREARLSEVFTIPDASGTIQESWKCGACGKQDERFYKPGSYVG